MNKSRLTLILVLIQAIVPVGSAFLLLQTSSTKTPRLCHDVSALSNTRRGSDNHGRSDAHAITTSPERPIVVIGAGGKTGRLITKLLGEQDMYVRAVTRRHNNSSSSKQQEESPYISYVTGDVTRYDSLLSILEKAQGVIWAATSSGVKQGGGDVVDVDYYGAYNTAKACISQQVPKLVFISAGCVTRPNSLGSIAVNKMAKLSYGKRCGWVDAKVAGEYAVRDLYNKQEANNNNNKKLTYAVVRPAAALVNTPALPVDDLIVLQGDVYSSAQSIPRANVAHVVVAALLKGKATDFVTFEVCPGKRLYKNDDGNVFDLLCWPSLNQKDDPEELPPELVHRNADSYEALLDGLVTDEDLIKSYGSIVSDYRGREQVPALQEDIVTNASI